MQGLGAGLACLVAPGLATFRIQTALPGASGAAKIIGPIRWGRLRLPIPDPWPTGRASAARPIPRSSPRKDLDNGHWRRSLS